MDAPLQSLATWFLLFICYSFIGWIFELISALFWSHHIYNRGFLLGPICPIYGLGAILITALLGSVENVISIFCVSLIAAGTLEYLTSFFMEKLFRARWWDYHDRAFNINGRVCLLTLALFGLGGVIVIKFTNPFLLGLLSSLPAPLLGWLALALAVVLFSDLIASLFLVVHFRVAAGTVERDATEEITKNIRALFAARGLFSRRLMKAFPDLKILKTSKTPKTASDQNSAVSQKSQEPQKPQKPEETPDPARNPEK